MNKKDPKQSSLGTMKKKTFRYVLKQFLEEECPQIGGGLTRDLLSEKIEALFAKFHLKADRLRMGQVMWNAVDEKEVSSYGKGLETVQINPVCLDLVTNDDLEQRLKGKRKKEIRKIQSKRLFEQAKEQKSVLTYTDVAEMMGLSSATVGRYVNELEKEDGYRVPHRGLLHDIGPTVTHKKPICFKILVEGKSVEQVARETHHSPEAITRYVKDYKRIHACFKHNLSVEETADCTGRSKRLVQEYQDLINEHEAKIDENLENF